MCLLWTSSGSFKKRYSDRIKKLSPKIMRSFDGSRWKKHQNVSWLHTFQLSRVSILSEPIDKEQLENNHRYFVFVFCSRCSVRHRWNPNTCIHCRRLYFRLWRRVARLIRNMRANKILNMVYMRAYLCFNVKIGMRHFPVVHIDRVRER